MVLTLLETSPDDAHGGSVVTTHPCFFLSVQVIKETEVIRGHLANPA